MNPTPRKILIVGGGFAGVYAFARLHKRYHKDASVELRMVSASDYFLFTPLLHEVATGGITEESVKFNIRAMLGCCLADFVQASALHVDLAKKTVGTTAGAFPYDVLIYALGAGTGYFSLPEDSKRHTVSLKTVEDARRIKARLVGLFEEAAEPSIVVVGGGPTGIEVAAEVREYFDTLRSLFKRTDGRVTVVHAGSRLLPQFHADLGTKATHVLETRGVDVVLNGTVQSVDAHHVVLADRRQIPANLVIWAAGVVAHRIPFTPDVQVDPKGRILVTPFLAVPDHPDVFVAGDAAGIDTVPMTAQAAVAMGEAAADNAIAFLSAEKPVRFSYRHRGDLFSLGQWLAGAEIFGMRFFGHFAWWLWRTVYLFKIIGVRNRVKVMVDWTFNLFLPRNIDIS